MKLAESGVLDLDAPIETYFAPSGAMHTDWQSLTLRALLSHSSGLPANPSPFAWLRGYGTDPSAALEDELARLWDDSIEGERGAFSYSNLGYMLAAHVIAAADGRSWRDLVDQ